MTLLHASRRTVACQRLWRYSRVEACAQYSSVRTRADRTNAFVSYNPNKPWTKPDPQALINAGQDGLLTKHQMHDESPFLAVKDNISTAEFSTTCASHALEGYNSAYEATVVSLLRQRGYKVVGKTNMDEFGMGSHSTHSIFGPVAQLFRNIDGQERLYSAGGSSGGSALAVSQGLCKVALGTDTGGSVRLPAAWCGVVGFKPSYGKVSRWGVIDYANSLDTVGFFAKNVYLVKKMLAVTAFYDKQDPTAIPPSVAQRMPQSRRRLTGENPDDKPWKVGVPIEYNIAELSPTVKQAWVEALETLKKLGHEIVPVSLPSTKSALSAYYVLAPAEASSNLAKYDGVRYGTRAEGTDGQNSILFSKTRSEGFGNEVKRRILLGSYSLSADAIDNYFIQAQKVRRLVQKEFNDVFNTPHPLLDMSLDFTTASGFDWETGPGVDTRQEEGAQQRVDFLLCPTAPTPPPQLEDLTNLSPVESYINDVFTVPASMAGLPAISIPWGENPLRDPSKNVGLQIIGQWGRDNQVLGVAKRIAKMSRPSDD